MNCRILKVLHMGLNPFRLQAWYRKSKRNRRWVEVNGEMIQIRTSRVRRRVPAGLNPFRLRTWRRMLRREWRWVEMNGEMIQIKMSRVKRRLPTPYRLPLRFDPLRERRLNRSAYPDLYSHYRFSRKSPWTEVRRSACKDKFHLELSWRKNDGKFWR